MPTLPRCAFILALLLSAAGAAAQEACQLATIGTADVTAVRDGRTLLLRDGREVRLAAIETTDTAQAALAALADGKTLTLKRLGKGGADRYGRLLVFAFLPDAAQSLQQTLLAAGQARVSPHVGDRACAEALLTVERSARAAKQGLWADPNFAPLPADDPARLVAMQGHFALVEGRVLSVHQSGGTIYLNFGRHWIRDFSITIAARLKTAFGAAGIAPQALEGRRVRVRGWIERRNGPVIDATAPEQIELVD